jgi:hypothetical protein
MSLENIGDYDASPFGSSGFIASAPLITAVSALFGNNSFLNIVDPHNNLTSAQILTLMCEHGSIPFSLSGGLVGLSVFRSSCFDVPSELVFDSRDPQGADSAVAEMIGTWFFNGFNSTDAAEYILDMSMFFANRAVLNKAVQLSSVDARPIYTSPGLQLIKPHKTLVGMIVVSALIAIQLVCLCDIYIRCRRGRRR